MDNEQYQQDLRNSWRASKQLNDWIYGDLLPRNTKESSITMGDLTKWAHKHSLTNAKLLWDGKALIRFQDWQGLTKTYPFDSLIQLIQEDIEG